MNVASGMVTAYSGLRPIGNELSRKIINSEKDDDSNVVMWICVGAGMFIAMAAMCVMWAIRSIRKRISR